MEQKKELITSLKRKAEDQQLILTDTLSSSTPDLNVVLPKLESLARVAQRARAQASGSANHPEAPTSADFVLPPTCQLTANEEDFVAYDGRSDKGSRILIFATKALNGTSKPSLNTPTGSLTGPFTWHLSSSTNPSQSTL